MRMAGLLALAVLCIPLAGCMTAEERRAADDAKCRSYGFRAKTDAFAECLQRIDLARQARLNDDRYALRPLGRFGHRIPVDGLAAGQVRHLHRASKRNLNS